MTKGEAPSLHRRRANKLYLSHGFIILSLIAHVTNATKGQCERDTATAAAWSGTKQCSFIGLKINRQITLESRLTSRKTPQTEEDETTFVF